MATTASSGRAGLFHYGGERAVSLRGSQAPSESPQYLAFDADLGGFNNILMNFEIIVVLAALTGRTLVIPPRRPLYLLGDEPRSLMDIFDRDALTKHIDVITTEELAARMGWAPEMARHQEFHDWMLAHAHNPGWNSDNNAVLEPANALTTRFELIPRLLRRRAVSLTGAAAQCEVLYFPSTAEHRILGPFETFFLFAAPGLERRTRRLVRDAVRYHPDILELAEQAVRESGLLHAGFGAMHVRRGDFQYSETRVEIESILAHTEGVFEPGQTLYVATDEQTASFLEPVRKAYRVVTFADLPPGLTERVPPEWIGIVETLICAAATQRFAGTRLSTFSARIATLRGYLSHTEGSELAGIDTTLYFTQPPLIGAGFPDAQTETEQPWWESAHTTPLWSRAYSSTWREVD